MGVIRRVSMAAALMCCALLITALAAAPTRGVAALTSATRLACPSAPADSVRCFAVIVVNRHPGPSVNPPAVLPDGYGPADIQSAYNLRPNRGADQTVAIVDAFDDPSAEADLATYRATYGLPACTTRNGCFRKVNSQGQQGNYPPPDVGWAEEIALDLDMVSASCPRCHILLVEATDASWQEVGKAVNTAARLGANEISNSYGDVETAQTRSFDKTFYYHPGVAQVAASGDTGYAGGVFYPATSPNVTAVGGTTLTQDSSKRGWSESVWFDQTFLYGTSSGCSSNEPKPVWQKDKGCNNRTDVDVAVVGDPNTGVAVYSTYQDPGWMVFGGTSVGSPIVAGIYALAGNAGELRGAARTYLQKDDLNDIVSGSNGTCDPAYLCTAGRGYDGPSGNGSPNGLGAF